MIASNLQRIMVYLPECAQRERERERDERARDRGEMRKHADTQPRKILTIKLQNGGLRW